MAHGLSWLSLTRFTKYDNYEEDELEQGKGDEDEDEAGFVIDDLLNHNDVMERDDLFDAIPINGKWYCYFSGIMIQNEDDEDLDESNCWMRLIMSNKVNTRYLPQNYGCSKQIVKVIHKL